MRERDYDDYMDGQTVNFSTGDLSELLDESRGLVYNPNVEVEENSNNSKPRRK